MGRGSGFKEREGGGDTVSTNAPHAIFGLSSASAFLVPLGDISSHTAAFSLLHIFGVLALASCVKSLSLGF